jgi:hypothetical protein
LIQEADVNTTVKAFSLAGVIAVFAAGTLAVAQLDGQQPTALTGDYRNAAVAEVQDGQGHVLFRGSFAPVDTDDEGEVERLASLKPASPVVKGTGEAEVEYQTDAPAEQEVEFTISGLTAGAEVFLVIDGQRVTTAKADKRGRVSVELAVRATQ